MSKSHHVSSMKLFDRTPTGRRVSRPRYKSYSKTDKPFSLKLKGHLSSKRTQFIIFMTCLICFVFLLGFILYPSSGANNGNNNNLEDEIKKMVSKNTSLSDIVSNLKAKSTEKLGISLQALLEKMKENPDKIDIDHIEQLLLHRNDLESYLNGIDDVLLQHKDKIADVLPFVPVKKTGNNEEEEEVKEKKKVSVKKKTEKKTKSRLKDKSLTDKDDIDKTKKSKKQKKMDKLKQMEAELAKKSESDNKKQKAQQEEAKVEQLSLSPSEIRLEIIDEFKYAYNCYKKCAWGFDTVHPISCTGTNDAFDLGLAMIDALDTLIIMNMVDHDIDIENDINDIKEWVTNKMRFDRKNEVSLFESTIRVLGGLLSAYHLTNHTYDLYSIYIHIIISLHINNILSILLLLYI